MKTKSKYILLLFVGIIVMLFGGIFFTVQQEKEGPITADASGPVYWLTEGSSLSTTSCLLCGQSVSASSGTSVAWQSTGTCSMDYYHWGPRGARICYAPITVHNGHFYQMDATCTKDGESYTVCTRCGTRTNETTIPATGHDYGEWFVATPATCTQNGTEQRVCQNSGCSARETRTIEATGHTWDSGTVTVSATCQRTGTRKYECTACGETKTETIAKRSHNYNIYLSRVEPTCTASGRTAGYECQWCYANTCSTIPALGHDLEYHDGQPATCTEIGWNDYETCSRCDYTTYREIAATGHTPGAAATCTTPQTCTECGAILVEALGHKTVSHLGQDPTCTAEGWKPYETCENCDYTTYEIIPALGHSFTSYVSNNDATCTDDGTETAKCDRCEVTDTRTDEGSALGHDWAEEWTTDGTAHWHECSRCDEINDKANHSGGTATCIALAKCEICGAKYGDLAEHVYVENAEEQYLVSAATCTAKATYYKSCSVCGEAGKEIFEYGEPLGHEYGEPEWTWEGYTSATATFTCTRGCGDKQTITASGSSITNVVTTPAECETEGLRTYTAKVMFGGEEYVTTTTETIEALGHDLEHHEAQPATCIEIGWNAYDTCTRCDYTTYVEIEALGHDWAEEWTTDGTAHWHECSRCDAINDKANHSGGTATCTNPAECEVCGAAYGDALGHTESEAVRENEVPASCTAAGSYDEVIYCSVCGEELSREEKVIDALGHDLEHHEAKPATCTEIGWDAYDTCSRCDYTTYIEIEALGHTEGEAVRENEVPASCTAAGSYDEVVYCSVCGEELSREEKVIDALGHSFTSYISDNNATCTEDGTETAKCDRCEVTDTRTDEGSALGHDWAEEWTTDGTAHWHECGRCDEINDKANHSGGEATCTNPAECEVCGVEYGSALGHTESEAVRENEVPASCTAAGSYDEVVYCSVCGEELSREEKVIDALGHSFTSYISDNNATCTEDGTETAKCDRCEVTDTRTDEGSALGHDWAEEWTTDGTAHWHECGRCDEINDKASHSGGTATCTNPAECEVCGAEYGEALGHDLEHHEAKPATCTEIGWEAYDTCTRCDYTTYVEIPAKGHTFGPDATCTEDQVCLECGEVISAATGHIPGPDATCTENQTCSVCGEILTPALGHSFTSYISDNNATCTEDGTETAKCDRCEVTDTRTDEGSALGHDLEHHEAKPATCTEIGWNAYDTCTRCDYTTYVEIEALGHNWAEEWTTDGTAHWHECSRCDEINDKASHSGGTATCIALAKCEICGVEYGDFAEHNFVDGYCTVCGIIDGTALDNDKDDAKADLDEIAQDAKDEIDGSDLPDDVKDDLKDKVDEIINGAKVEVEGSTDFDDVDQTVENAKDEIEDAILDAEKNDAKSDLDEIAQNVKDEIDGSELSDEEKTELKDKIDEIVNDAKAEIEGASSKDEIEESFSEAESGIEEVNREALENAKEDVLAELEELAQSIKDEIDGSDLSDGAKNQLKDKIDEIIENANSELESKTTFDEVYELGDVIKSEISAVKEEAITIAKEEAVAALEAYVESAKNEIAASDLSTEEQADHTGQIDAEAESTKEEIVAATDFETIANALKEAMEEIDRIQAIGHIAGPAATCTTPQVCTVCGKELAPALGHDEIEHDGQPATCTEAGWADYVTCSRCDYSTYQTIPALGHTKSDPVRENVVEASCTAAGSYDEVVYCSVCGEELSREEKVVEALGHDLVKHEGQAATCTQNGWNDYETCTRCDYTTYREIAATGHTPGAAATCTSAQRCTVCGTTLVPARGHHFVDGYCSVCGAIDGTALDNDKDDAKTDLDDIAQDAKDEIDGSDLPDDVKEDLKDKVDEIINGAKDEVEGSTDFDDIDQAVENTKDEIEDAILDAEKDDAKSDLDEIAQGAKDEVDGSDLPDDVKDDLKDKIDEIVNDAKTEIDGETSKEEVDQTVEDAQQEIEDAILNAEKDDAKSDLDKIAQSAKDEIGSSGISDEEKAELKDKVDAAIEDAKEAIDNATSKEEIENIVNDTREDIDDLLKGSLDNELAEKKDAAISDLTEIAQDAKDGIDGSDISDEEKDELKGKVDEIVNDAKDEIEGAVTPEEIDEILAEAENEIAAVTEDLKAGQLNTSTLWPWIIVAIVISAALSTLFAWRHVKKVQGKGEAVGAKSVVTIAVATILIFVVVIGITLLIFAMV